MRGPLAWADRDNRDICHPKVRTCVTGQRPRRLLASLHLSSGTVRNHLSAAIQKLGARNRAEAVQIAERKGWL